MKFKLAIDTSRLKSFFVKHGEKVALGVCGLVFLQMAWSAWQVKPYQRTPQQLASATGQVREAVVRQPWDPQARGVRLPNPDFATQVNVATRNVNQGSLYAFATDFSRPIEVTTGRRVEPRFLAVRSLRGTFGFGYVPPKSA